MREDVWLNNLRGLAPGLLLILLATGSILISPNTSIAIEESSQSFSITLRYSGIYSLYTSGKFSLYPDSAISITIRYWVDVDVVLNDSLLIDNANLSLTGMVSAIDGVPPENINDLKNDIEALLIINLTLVNITGEELPLILDLIVNNSGVQVNLRKPRYDGLLTGVVRLDIDGFLFTGRAMEDDRVEFWSILLEPFTRIPIQFSGTRRISSEEGSYTEMVTLNLDNYILLSRLARRNVYEVKLTTGNTSMTFPLIVLSADTGATYENTTVKELNATLVITDGSRCIVTFGPVPRDINISSNVSFEKYTYMQKNVYVTLFPVSCEKGVYIFFEASEFEAVPKPGNVEEGVAPRYYTVGVEDVIFVMVFTVLTCIAVFIVVYLVSRRVI